MTDNDRYDFFVWAFFDHKETNSTKSHILRFESFSKRAMVRIGESRNLASMPSIGQEELGWMAIGFAFAIFCFGLLWFLFRCYQSCECNRVPGKISTPPHPLPAGDTQSESEDGGSRLARFFQQSQQLHHVDETSDVSQSDVWSFSLKSFTAEHHANATRYDDGEPSDDADDLTFDASLYTTAETLPPPTPLQRSAPTKNSSRRFEPPKNI